MFVQSAYKSTKVTESLENYVKYDNWQNQDSASDHLGCGKFIHNYVYFWRSSFVNPKRYLNQIIEFHGIWYSERVIRFPNKIVEVLKIVFQYLQALVTFVKVYG